MTHKALENYFFRIVNNKPKELTMLDVLKAKWAEFWTVGYTWVDEEPKEIEDYWSFYARTEGYDEHPSKESFINGKQDGTWMEVLDQILDVLGHHYGYNIKEQVYYSVHFPLNMEGQAGYGREINDELFQQLLLTHPELYEVSPKEAE